MSHDIFLSHANHDANLASQIAVHMQNAGISCWMASRDIPVCKDFDVAIVEAIDNCHAALLVLSESSNASPFVFSEVNRAFAKGKPIFTFRLSDILPAPQLELYIARQQWLDGFPPPIEKRLNMLASAIISLRNEPTEPNAVRPTNKSSCDQAIETVRQLSSRLYTDGLDDRIRTAARVAELARMLSLPDIASLCASSDRGERVAGFICLGVLIGGGIPLSDLTRLTAVLELGVRDPESRVRFRAAEAVGCSPLMLNRFRTTLRHLSTGDPNLAVREITAILAQEQRI